MAILIRTCIAGLFFYLDVPFMAYYNVGAVFFSFLLVYKVSHIQLKSAFWFACIEVLVACTLAIHHIGWDCGFSYYMFLLVPIFFLYSKWSTKERLFFLMLVISAFSVDFYLYKGKSAIYSIDASVLNSIEMMSISFTFFTIVGALVYFNRTITDYESQLIASNDDLRKRNLEKEVMLKEIHHRVKNNLHVVNSIMELQTMEVTDPKIKSYLQDAQRRIITMATIHEKMYGSENLRYISVKEYFTSFMNDLARMYDSERNVEVKLALEDLPMDLDTLAPLAFLFNEIITNSYKHAFTSGTIAHPQINCTLKTSGNRVFMVISDNGEGFEQKFNEKDSSIGVDLIQAFAEELEANISRVTESGTTYRFDFNKKLKLPDISPTHGR